MRRVAGEAELLEDTAGGAGVVADGQEEMFNGDVVVLELFRFAFRFADEAIEAAGHAHVAGGSRDARQLFQLTMQLEFEPIDGDIRLVKDGGRQPALLIEQRQQQVLDVHLLMIKLRGQPLRSAQGFQ